MVEKHIFSPEPDIKGTYKSPFATKLEKELTFTGVIISPQGKWAMIREKGKRTDEAVSSLHKEGDEIKGLSIRQIGNNFLILASDGKEVRLNLYYEGKPRPEKPAETEASPTSETERPATAPPAASKTRGVTGTVPRKSPLSQGTNRSMPGPGKTADVGPPTSSNPFLDAMPGDQPGGNEFPPDTMPSPQDSSPNPFLQETPPNPFLGQGPDTGSR